MPDIKFECPNCGQHIAAEEEYAGMSAQCPTCSCSLTIPDVSSAVNTDSDEVIMHIKSDSWESILAHLKLVQSRNIRKLTLVNKKNGSLSLERNEYYIATFDDNRNILTTLSTALTFKKVIEIFEEFYKTQIINRQKVRWKNTFETAETHDNPLSQYEQENISHLYSQTPMQKRSAAQASFSTNQDGHKKCRTCDGLGKTYTYGGREKICQACEGTGIIAKKQDKILNQPWEQFFSMDSKNLGCGGVIILLSPLFLFLLFGSIGSCSSSSGSSSSHIKIVESHSTQREAKIKHDVEVNTKQLVNNLASLHRLTVSSLDIQPYVDLNRQEAEAYVYVSLINGYGQKEKWKYYFVFKLGNDDKLYFKKDGFSSEKLD